MLAVALAVGALYTLGAFSTTWLFSDFAPGIVFFPSAGITVAALLLTPRRWWPLILSAVAIAEIGTDLYHDQTVFMAVGFAIANVVEPLVGATLMLAVNRGRPRSARAYLMWFVLCAVVIGPMVGATIGGVVSALADAGSFRHVMPTWWLGDALGVLIIGTPILAFTKRADDEAPASLGEDVAIACFAGAIVIVPAVSWHHGSVVYAVLPVLMWAALRGGPFGVGLSSVAVAFSTDWVISSGRASQLFANRDKDLMLVNVQLFLAVTVLAALAFAVEVGERTRAERVLREAEAARAREHVAGLDAAANERSRIAREAHDIFGHALNIMILSSGAARRVLRQDPDAAQELLLTTEDVGRDAFRDLDTALGLADQSPDLAPQRGLADLDELVDRLARAGLAVEYTIGGEPRPLPRLVDWSAYRIIQESLTNVVKHAESSPAYIDIRYEPTALHLRIVDLGADGVNGNGRDRRRGGDRRYRRNGRNGRGLVGMRERVAVLGGRLDAGPAPGGGFAVKAEIPTERV